MGHYLIWSCAGQGRHQYLLTCMITGISWLPALHDTDKCCMIPFYAMQKAHPPQCFHWFCRAYILMVSLGSTSCLCLQISLVPLLSYLLKPMFLGTLVPNNLGLWSSKTHALSTVHRFLTYFPY
jgi:hypothetical protein